MSGVRPRTRPTVSASSTANPSMGDVLNLFAPEALGEMIIEGFARAFERKMEGTSMDVLTEALQLAADLRVFREGLFLTGNQVCAMLQISERTLDRLKKEKKIEVDPHLGEGSHRYSLFSIVQARSRLLREAAAVPR